MPLTPTQAVTAQDISANVNNENVAGAADDYQSFLVTGSVEAPLGVQQISGFAFDYEGDDSVDLQNEITDHWVEDNVAVQDHIGVRPVTVTLKGRVSELAFSATTSGAVLAALTGVENGLSALPAFIGAYTPGVANALLNIITQAQNIAIQIEQAAARVAQIANFFNGPQRNKQQTAFAMLSALRNARVLFTVYTPFQVFYDMAIVSINATQPAASKTVSDFSVTMKQLQFTDDISQSSFLGQYGGRAAAGYQPPTSNGLTSGVSSSATSVASFF